MAAIWYSRQPTVALILSNCCWSEAVTLREGGGVILLYTLQQPLVTWRLWSGLFRQEQTPSGIQGREQEKIQLFMQPQNPDIQTLLDTCYP